MKLNTIETAPLNEEIFLYWNDSGHFENGKMIDDKDEEGNSYYPYHVLFDGSSMDMPPTHWAKLPGFEF